MLTLAKPNATALHALYDSAPQQPKLLDQMRAAIRVKHYSYSTEKTYLHWAKRFILFHGKRHPADMGAPEVEAFLSMLANQRDVAASTQNQALAALLFLYKQALGIDLPWLDGITRAKKPARLPVVLSQGEVAAVLGYTRGTSGLIIRLLYGTGMRLMEAMRLRVKDIDFASNIILVRSGKGDKDRVVPLPASLAQPLRDHLAARRKMHDLDLARGMVDVELPHALDRKYPNALFRSGDAGQALRAELAAARRRLIDAEAKLERLGAALAEDDGAVPITLLRQMRTLEAAAESERLTIEQGERELAGARQVASPDLAEKWLGLMAGVEALDPAARMEARELVRASFKRIVIWHAGDPVGDDVLDMEFTARGGGSMRMRVDRATGGVID